MAQAPARYERVPVPSATFNQQVIFPAQQTPGVGVVTPREKYKGALYSLGLTELILGTLSVLLSVVIMAIDSPWAGGLTYSAQGIWCGGFLIASGILGLKAKVNSSACMYNANMALSIITACFQGILVILSSIAAAVSYYSSVGVWLHSIIAILGFTGMIITIVHSAYCCAGVCCYGNKYQGTVMYMPHQYMPPPQQMVQLANGQYMMVPSQSVMAPAGYPYTSIPINGPPVTYQPQPVPVPQGSTLPPQQVVYPSTSTGVPQPAQMTKEQEAEGNPPGYSTLPKTDNPNA